MSRRMDPLRLIIWAGIEGVIEGAKMSGLLQTARTIAQKLEGATGDDKLSNYELGEDNRAAILQPGIEGKLIAHNHCIFSEVDSRSLPWSKGTLELLSHYNELPSGGGAIHPLCIVHHEIRRKAGNATNIGARPKGSKEAVISKRALEKVGLSKDDAAKLLENKVCIYHLPD